MNEHTYEAGYEQTPIADSIAKTGNVFEWRSQKVNELFAALAQAQAEMKPANLNAYNPFYKSKYAEWSELVRVSRPALTKHGLTILQPLMVTSDGHELRTILGHKSGQWVASSVTVKPPKPDVQSFAGFVTYMRRHCYAALLGIVASEEEDDGNSLVNNSVHHNDQTGYIDEEQVGVLEQELRGHQSIKQQVLNGLGIESLAQMPKEKFFASLNRIKDIKKIKPS